jgi:TonB family protein
VAISLAVNLLVVTQLDASWLKAGKLSERREVSIAPLAAVDWEANRAVRPPSAAPPVRAPSPPAPIKPKDAGGQVVDLGPPPPTPDPRKPKDTPFVSDRDSFAEKETRARVTKLPGQKTSPVPVGPAAVAGLAGTQGQAEQAAPGAPGAKGAKGPVADKASKAPDQPRTDPPPPTPGELAAARPESPPPGGGVGEGGEQRRGQPDARLAIPPQTLARLAGGASMDHLRDVEAGDGTFLNTREWKYATYMNRIKESISTTWDPRSALERRDPDGTIYAFKDRYTLLSVTLDDKGGLKDLSVARTSNVDFLDRVALDAIRKAQPFPNPPAGLVDGSGEVRFTFGFYLTAGHSGLRAFRNQSPQ